MRIKKAGILIIAAAITCTTPAVPAMAADTSESVQEIISDNEIDSLVSDPDGASTLARNKNYYKPQKCGLFYVKFYLFLFNCRRWEYILQL